MLLRNPAPQVGRERTVRVHKHRCPVAEKPAGHVRVGLVAARNLPGAGQVALAQQIGDRKTASGVQAGGVHRHERAVI